MGRHFDTLIETIKKGLTEKEQSIMGIHRESHVPDIRAYLEKLIRRAALFEFPLNAEEIFPKSGKEDKEYNRYLCDYFDMSEQNGYVFITPFPITAIEDKDSVVFLEKVVDDTYRIISCRKDLPDEKIPEEITTLFIAEVSLQKPEQNGGFLLPVVPLYCANWSGNLRMSDIFNDVGGMRELRKDSINETVSYIEEIIYLMDPENFIIEKESNASKKQKGKSAKKKGFYSPLRKTIMRPHYVCLSEPETKDFLQDESKEPRPFHPVRGHWRRFMSDRYVNRQGQRMFIAQHYRGKGDIEGRNGWNYRVMLKEGPTKIVAYQNSS